MTEVIKWLIPQTGLQFVPLVNWFVMASMIKPVTVNFRSRH